MRPLHFLAAFFALVTLAAAQTPSVKKGWDGDLATAQKLKAHWFYNWGPSGAGTADVEFVPMIKGKAHVNARTLDAVKASGAKALLCFNEPERKDQGNLSVEEALDLWPQLMATGLRLGSPAPSSDGRGMEWLSRFMEGARSRKLRVDFIALHWYRSANPEDFEHWLDEIHRQYHLPIWLTEFNAQYSGGDRERFAKQAFRLLDRKSYVERYAYFTPGPDKPASLWKQSWGDLSPLGQDYAKK